MKLLMHRSLNVDRHILERIMQAVLFYAESVTIRAAATAGRGDRWLIRRINQLVDIGAITTWAHEYELDRRGRVGAVGPNQILRGREPDAVVTIETARELVREVDEELARIRGTARLYEPTSSRQGVAEVVQFRHSMSVLRLTDHLGAGGVVTGQRDRSHLLMTIEKAALSADRRESIVRELVSRCSFGPLADLPMKAIEDCRRETARFSALLDKHIADATEEATSAQLAQAILAEYQRVGAGRRSRAHPDQAGTPTWDVVGAVLPRAVIVKMMGTRVEWFRHHKHARPFMLLGKLTYHAMNS